MTKNKKNVASNITYQEKHVKQNIILSSRYGTGIKFAVVAMSILLITSSIVPYASAFSLPDFIKPVIKLIKQSGIDPIDQPTVIKISDFKREFNIQINDKIDSGDYNQVKWENQGVRVTRSLDHDQAIHIEFDLIKDRQWPKSNKYAYVKYDLMFTCDGKNIVQHRINDRTSIDDNSVLKDFRDSLPMYQSNLVRNESCTKVDAIQEGLVYFSAPLPKKIINENMELFGASVKITTADVKHANTNDDVIIKLNNIWTIPNTEKDDFERGDTRVYALNSYGVKKIKDINQVVIDHNGKDGWCIQEITLDLNGKTVYDREFSPCRWFDGNTKQRIPSESSSDTFDRIPHPPRIISYDELRDHDLWQQAFTEEVNQPEEKCSDGTPLPCKVECPDGTFKDSFEECFDVDGPILPFGFDKPSTDSDPGIKTGGRDPIVFGTWSYIEPGNGHKCANSPNPFDFDNDGFKEHMCYWYSPETKILFVDFDGDKQLDNGYELLNVDKYENALELLSTYPDLCIYYDCYVWNDQNSNIRVDEGELEEITQSFNLSEVINYPKGKLSHDVYLLDEREREYFIYGETEDENLGTMYATKPTYWMKGI